MIWIDVLLTILSLIIIPYGFIKRKNWARIYALIYLFWFAFETIRYIVMTGEKSIYFLLFVACVLFIMYLLMSPVKRYFNKNSTVIVPSDEIKEYKYNDYTLYSKLVRLKNGKLQTIYFSVNLNQKVELPLLFPMDSR
jgi:hypothetical protein